MNKWYYVKRQEIDPYDGSVELPDDAILVGKDYRIDVVDNGPSTQRDFIVYLQASEEVKQK